MYYTNLPYKNKNDWFGRNPIHRLPKPVRINVRSLNKLPTTAQLFIRHGGCIKYKTGYWTPLKRIDFKTAQEVSKFLHTDGRYGLYYVGKYYDGWSVWECKRVANKVLAEKISKHHGFRHFYRCSDGEWMRFK